MAQRRSKSQSQTLRLIALLGHQVYKLPQKPPVTMLLIAGMVWALPWVGPCYAFYVVCSRG